MYETQTQYEARMDINSTYLFGKLLLFTNFNVEFDGEINTIIK